MEGSRFPARSSVDFSVGGVRPERRRFQLSERAFTASVLTTSRTFSFSPSSPHRLLLVYPRSRSLDSFCSTPSRESFLPLLFPFGCLVLRSELRCFADPSPSNLFPLLPHPSTNYHQSTIGLLPGFFFHYPNLPSPNADLASGSVNSPAPFSFSGSPFHSGKPR